MLEGSLMSVCLCVCLAVLEGSLMQCRASLVIAPSHLTKQWQDEVETTCPSLRVIVITTKFQHEKVVLCDMNSSCSHCVLIVCILIICHVSTGRCVSVCVCVCVCVRGQRIHDMCTHKSHKAMTHHQPMPTWV